MLDMTQKRFTDDDAAREYLEEIRWPHGAVCPHCGCDERIMTLQGKSHRKGLYKCGDCREQFTVTVKTVFERSKIPLHKWVMATTLMCSSKKGISAHQLHRMLGITYKSAWFMCHRIREAMKDHKGLLGGGGKTVEIDETFWGGEARKKLKPKKARGYHHKGKVFALVERNGRARSFHVNSIGGKTIFPIMKEHIAKDTHINTDEGSNYVHVAQFKDVDRAAPLKICLISTAMLNIMLANMSGTIFTRTPLKGFSVYSNADLTACTSIAVYSI